MGNMVDDQGMIFQPSGKTNVRDCRQKVLNGQVRDDALFLLNDGSDTRFSLRPHGRRARETVDYDGDERKKRQEKKNYSRNQATSNSLI